MRMNTYNLNDLVVLGTLISLEVMREALGVLGDFRAFGCVQVVDHAVVEGEERGSSTDLSTHVANRGHARAREGLDTRTTVLDNGTSSTLDSQDTSNLEDDVFVTL